MTLIMHQFPLLKVSRILSRDYNTNLGFVQLKQALIIIADSENVHKKLLNTNQLMVSFKDISKKTTHKKNTKSRQNFLKKDR